MIDTLICKNSSLSNQSLKRARTQDVVYRSSLTVNRRPVISVIIAVYNGASTLSKAIESVLVQKDSDVELIIIDGGSSDGTIDVIKGYADEIDCWVSGKDEGIYDAWNKGINLSRGEWVGFIGADDAYIPGALPKYLSVIKINSQSDYISSQSILVKNGKKLRIIGTSWQWNKFRKYMCVAHVGSLHKKQYFQVYGCFDSTFRISGDYELLMRSGSKLKSSYINEPTVLMEVGGVSDSSKAVFDEVKRIKKMYSDQLPITITLQNYIAVIKWYIRKIVWY